MIRIIAQPVQDEDELAPKEQVSQPAPQDIPLADEDVPDIPKAPEIPKSVPVPEPLDIEQTLEPAGELPPKPSFEPRPTEEFEELVEPPSELDVLNQTLSIQQKLQRALVERRPLRIIYTTLKGHTTERTIEPDYVHMATTTGNQILIAWDHLRGAWRGFIINRIRGAKLEEI